MKTTFLIIELTIALAFVLAFTPLGSWLRKVSHKSLLRNFCILCVCGLFCGCSTTTITETKYNADGSIASQTITKTTENALVVLSKDIGKGNIAFKQGGWLGNIGVNAQTQTYGIQLGSVDNSLIFTQDSSNGVNFSATIPPAWDAQKYSLEINKDGMKAEGNEVPQNSNDSTEAKTTESEAK